MVFRSKFGWVANGHRLGFFRIQDGRQNGRHTGPKSNFHHNFCSKYSKMVIMTSNSMFAMVRNPIILIFYHLVAILTLKIQDDRPILMKNIKFRIKVHIQSYL